MSMRDIISDQEDALAKARALEDRLFALIGAISADRQPPQVADNVKEPSKETLGFKPEMAKVVNKTNNTLDCCNDLLSVAESLLFDTDRTMAAGAEAPMSR